MVKSNHRGSGGTGLQQLRPATSHAGSPLWLRAGWRRSSDRRTTMSGRSIRCVIAAAGGIEVTARGGAAELVGGLRMKRRRTSPRRALAAAAGVRAPCPTTAELPQGWHTNFRFPDA